MSSVSGHAPMQETIYYCKNVSANAHVVYMCSRRCIFAHDISMRRGMHVHTYITPWYRVRSLFLAILRLLSARWNDSLLHLTL